MTVGDTALGILPLLGHCIDGSLKHSPDFLRNRPICLSRFEGQVSVWHIHRGLLRGFQRMEAGEWNCCTLLMPQSSSPVSYRKQFILFSSTLIFAVMPEDTSILPGSDGKWLLSLWVP